VPFALCSALECDVESTKADLSRGLWPRVSGRMLAVRLSNLCRVTEEHRFCLPRFPVGDTHLELGCPSTHSSTPDRVSPTRAFRELPAIIASPCRSMSFFFFFFFFCVVGVVLLFFMVVCLMS